MRIMRIVIGLAAALALLGVIGFGALTLARTTPDVNQAWFLGGAGVLYAMATLYWLHR